MTDYPGPWQGSVFEADAYARALMTPGTLDADTLAPVAADDSPMPHPFLRNWLATGSRGRWQQWPGTAWPSGDPTYPTYDPDYSFGYSYLCGYSASAPSWESGALVAQQLILEDTITWEGSLLAHPAYAVMPPDAIGVEFASGEASAYTPITVHNRKLTLSLVCPTNPSIVEDYEVIATPGDFADIDLVGDWNHGLTGPLPAPEAWDLVGSGTAGTDGSLSVGQMTYTVAEDAPAHLLVVRGSSNHELDIIVDDMVFTRDVTWDDYRYLYATPQTGMWTVRQRQTAGGNAGGWPLRQRHNGGFSGTWSLRQRQTGL